MKNQMVMKVPLLKYQQAKQYQINLQNKNGLNLPLWACLLENEKQQKQKTLQDDINKFYRRLI